jgi:hypothetical protein
VGALVLLAAGCGGRHRTAPSLSRTAFVQAANRICAEATTHGSRIARLRTLRPPMADADLFGHWLTAERDARRAAEALAGHGTAMQIDPAVALAIAEGKVAGYAGRLGATTCAKRTIGTMPP